eukprot:m.167518 g.167518  ORF g.167518 m.167518 type:complete len:241 (+) comp12837_c0_seq1:37-759(+)
MLLSVMTLAAVRAAPAPDTGVQFGPIRADATGRAVIPSIGDPRSFTLPSGEVIKGEVKGVSRHAVTTGDFMTQITFSYQNLFNSSTEPLQVDSTSVNLWSGLWAPSPMAPPCSGEFKPLKSGALNYGFAAITNPADPKNPHLINGSFLIRPKACIKCGNFSLGFAGYAFAMIPVGDGGNEIIIETSGAYTDDVYSEDFGSIVAGEMVETLILRHRDCDPQGWSKCKACTCPPPPSAQPSS